ncbi:hypothetical protein EXN22_04840 [Pseudomonas tructae]|uniref:Uncharacterized protein n=1 Tax=Pseudomonas tructae TaxID=2518644 RepID=A0A411ME33_9PSED|nr:hypothetical protein [Pseudomonas tructae]QBF25046.1 hypothetical protein EXN22_04840 [Pseudomonas tructae]
MLNEIAQATVERWLRRRVSVLVTVGVLLGADSIHAAVERPEGKPMEDVCSLDENLLSFERYVRDVAGARMDLDAVAALRGQFTVIKDEPAIDALYSSTDKVRFIGLSRECTAADGVHVHWNIALSVDMKGNPVFHQFLLLYNFEDLLEGRRAFSFEHFRGSAKHYSQLLSKAAAGVMTQAQFTQYMNTLGALPVPASATTGRDQFIYTVPVAEDMASRMAAWDFSKTITATYNQNQLVVDVVVD